MTFSTLTRLPGTPTPMHYWQGAGSLRIAGDSWGSPEDPAIFLLHGGGQTRHSWRSTGTQLADNGYFVVALDARGHGDSDWAPDGNYHQDAFIEDIKSVARSLGIGKPIVMGASLGGNTALAAIGEHTLDAAALILIDVVPRTERAGFRRISGFMQQKPEGFASLEEVSESINAYRERVKPLKNPAGIAKNVRLATNGRLYWHWDPAFLVSREGDLAVRHQRLARAAGQLTVPTLLVRGGSSDVVSDEGVEEFLRLCPHAEYLNLAGIGHMVTGDDNSNFGKSTLDFLARIIKR